MFVEYAESPLAIGTRRPRFSREVPLEGRGRKQSAYQILWDEAGKPGGFRKPEYFETALFDESDWEAEWIGMGDPGEPVSDPTCFQRNRVPPAIAALEPDPRAPMMRKAFALEKPVSRARVFACGLGLFELRLNGGKVGKDVLATPRTDFRKRALYSGL